MRLPAQHYEHPQVQHKQINDEPHANQGVAAEEPDGVGMTSRERMGKGKL